MKPYFLKMMAAIAMTTLMWTWGHSVAGAAGYPERTITIVVPYPPGGSTDLIARLLGQRLSDLWGQPVVVANVAGAGGSIGAGRVAKSTPDGYTLLMSTNSPISSNLVLYSSLDYKAGDLEPVALMVNSPMLLVTTPKLPAHSLQELISLAKQKPGGLLAGISGNGAATHLAIAELSRRAGVTFTIVPYRGGAPMMTALLSGDEIQLAFNDIVPSLPLVREKRVRALGTPQPHRSVVAPDIPTVDEQGMKGFDITPWTGMFAPKGTPQEIVEKLNSEVNRIFAEPTFKQRIIAAGQEPVPAKNTAQFRAFVEAEIPRWQNLVRQTGASIENNPTH